MKHTLIAISHSAIMSSEGLIIALLGTTDITQWRHMQLHLHTVAKLHAQLS